MPCGSVPRISHGNVNFIDWGFLGRENASPYHRDVIDISNTLVAVVAGIILAQ